MLLAIARLMGHVFSLAYVAPYTGRKRHTPVAADRESEGRDPNW
jgi:hypothetical protein